MNERWRDAGRGWPLLVALLLVAVVGLPLELMGQDRPRRGGEGGRARGEARASQAETDGSGAGSDASANANASAEADADAKEGDADERDGPELLSLSFKDMSLEDLARFISEKTGKPVIPEPSIKDTKITIVSTKQMTLPAAMGALREAMRLSGVIMEEHEHLISLRPIAAASRSNLPIIGADESIGDTADPALIVRKVFEVSHQDPETLKAAIEPMLPEFGSVVADTHGRKLVVTDTVAGLRRIAEVLRTLDVQTAGDTIRKIIELEHADASWVVSIIKLTVSGDESASTLGMTSGGSGGQQSSRWNRSQPRRGGGNQRPSEAVAISSADGPMLLVPEVTRNWIIAVASATTMRQIERWVEELDQPTEVEDGYQLYDVRHADITEVAAQITQVIEATPNLQESVRVVPFTQSRKLLVFGSGRGQRLVASLLEQLDAEDVDNKVMKVIVLEHADAETVAAGIEELFSTQYVSSRTAWSTSYSRAPAGSVEVKVTPDIRRNSITVVTDAATLAKIEALIQEQWDLPLDTGDVQPRVYRLQHADPVQVRDLLNALFTEQQQSFSSLSYFFGGGGMDQNSPVGRLFGQFSFQALPNSNQLVVTTTNVINFEVIDRLIEDLDAPQDAGLPQMVELVHAHAEDLAEQINATLAEPGTLAQILRSERDLVRQGYSGGIAEFINTGGGGSGGGGGGGGGGAQQGQQGQQPDPSAMRFWWQDAQDDPTQQPTSNLIGNVRVVPVARRNALLILAPPAYREPILGMIDELDRPGSQVIIRAVIAEVQHEDTTTLGVRIASDPGALSDPALSDQAIGGGANADFNQLLAEPFEIGDDSIARGIFSANLDLNVLLQVLMRKFGLNILTEPKLYTADNEEAEFFDGRDVSIQIGSQTSSEGTLIRSFTYVPIGTQLRVRPHITREGDVNLRINLVLSSISPGENTFGNPIFDRRETSTHVVVQDGQTIMLSGIVRQEEYSDVRKLPLLGHIPVLGGLFRSTDRGVRNRELVIFITPDVVANNPEAVDEAMAPYREKLEELRRQLQPQEEIVRQPVGEEGGEGEGDETK